MWLMQTKWIILCLVPVLTVGTWRTTLPREHFKATCFGEVSFPDIIVGPSTEKEGLGRKRKRRMMIAILCPLKNSVTLQWKTMKKMELLEVTLMKKNNGNRMRPLMVLVESYLMQSETVKQEKRRRSWRPC